MAGIILLLIGSVCLILFGLYIPHIGEKDREHTRRVIDEIQSPEATEHRIHYAEAVNELNLEFPNDPLKPTGDDAWDYALPPRD